jgi:hypothetical protein
MADTREYSWEGTAKTWTPIRKLDKLKIH